MQIRKRSAFTMMEIMVVLIIVGALLAFIGPRIGRYLFQSKEAATKLGISKIKNALIEYSRDVGHYPSKKEGGLEALVTPPSGGRAAQDWQGPYLRDEDLLDGWKIEFEFNAPPVEYKKFRLYEIISSAGGERDPIVDGE